MNIAFFEVEDWEIPYLQKALSGHTARFYKQPLTKDFSEDTKDVSVVSPFIYSTVTSEILGKFSSLRYVVTRSTGFDHIDLTYCKEKGIKVSNVPEYGTHTVAEHTFALILAITRNIIPSVERARTGDFSLDGLRGSDLYGKTLGVVGFGHIGKAVIVIAKGFGMKIVVHTTHPDMEYAKQNDIAFVPLNEVFAKADIVTLHVPYNKETHHLINKNNIELFKKGSVLINTARGGIIETEAILVGLEKGILSAAGIDVLEEECYIKEERELLTEQFLKTCDLKTQLLNHVLLTKKNVLITSHNAFNSHEALQKILDVTVENIIQFEKNKIQNLVV